MPYLFTAEQIRSWEQFTIEHEPISSIQLMERASLACFDWIANKFAQTQHFSILCGYGNNGGDGLALARMLHHAGFDVDVFLLPHEQRSEDNLQNLSRLHEIHFDQITTLDNNTLFKEKSILIDALFGTGLSRPLEENLAEIIKHVNLLNHPVISIDLPSGLMADNYIPDSAIIQATYTLCFEQYKKSCLFEETGKFCGEIVILPIGLHAEYLKQTHSTNYLVDNGMLKAFYKKRKPYTHKGSYGHSLLIAGSHGKMGACILSAKACLKSGTGLLTCLIPALENNIIQISVPEAMTTHQDSMNEIDFSVYQSIGIGPGLGTTEEAFDLLKKLLQEIKIPLVIDADAINLLAQHMELLQAIPRQSVLTPHPKEFDRLFGTHENSYARHEAQKALAKQHQIYILLKGTHSCLATPDGECYFNITGNAGLAKGGSGDVLTGMITGFYAQYKDMKIASLLSMNLHGMSADLAIKKIAPESLLASDVINHI